MSRATCIARKKVGFECTIGEMRQGEWGYCVPWAYESKSETINLGHCAGPEGSGLGTATMEVECITPRKFYYVWSSEDRYIRQAGDAARCVDMSKYSKHSRSRSIKHTISKMKKDEIGYIQSAAFNRRNRQVDLRDYVYPTVREGADMEIKCVRRGRCYLVSWSPDYDRYCFAGTEHYTPNCNESFLHEHGLPIPGYPPYPYPYHYPRRRSVVKFEKYTDDGFYVWSDLTIETIKRMPGVSFATQYVKGKILVLTDPRYDMQDIKNEIERLAREQ